MLKLTLKVADFLFKVFQSFIFFCLTEEALCPFFWRHLSCCSTSSRWSRGHLLIWTSEGWCSFSCNARCAYARSSTKRRQSLAQLFLQLVFIKGFEAKCCPDLVLGKD